METKTMADKEERILITKCSSHCHALRISCAPFYDDYGMFCDKSGKWVRITEKDCAKCKNPVLAGITRADAVERMAKAIICRACEDYLHEDTDPLTSSASAVAYAEAALNALLEDK